QAEVVLGEQPFQADGHRGHHASDRSPLRPAASLRIRQSVHVACDRAQLTFGSSQQHDARRVRAPFMKEAMSSVHLENFIGGEYAEARTGRRTELVDPSTGEVFGEWRRGTTP